MQDLIVAIIQSRLFWEDRDANLNSFAEKIRELPEYTDLLILPEMFTTGFSMNPSALFEDSSGPTILWMKELAAERNVVICGSIIFKEAGAYYNRLIWMRPEGTYSTYDKRHLFRMGEENLHYTSGKSRLIEELKGWKIFPLICYDLRFPVWSRRTPQNNFDCLIYVANWPARRSLHWKLLLQARAIENQSYCIGLNRVGDDGNALHYSGDSSIFGPKGDLLFSKEDEETVFVTRLSYNELTEYRKSFPVERDADEFEIKG